MDKKQQQNEPKKRFSPLNALFERPERDQEYMTDLNSQWASLDGPGKAKFVIGAILALILFVAALGLVLWVIGRIMN